MNEQQPIVWDHVDALNGECVEARWAELYNRHFPKGVTWNGGWFEVPDPSRFRGRVRSGRMGDMCYCHLEVSAHAVQAPHLPKGEDDCQFVLLLQLSGVSCFRDDRQSISLRPHAMLFVPAGCGPLRVEHRTPVEQLLLWCPQPLKVPLSATHHARLRPRDAQLGMARQFFRLMTDACSVDEITPDAAHQLSRVFTQLMTKLLSEPDAGGERRLPPLGRAAIEDYVRRHLADPGLELATIAAAFDCSPRTLHRAFQQPDGLSIERYLWRARLEACAQMLQLPQAAGRAVADIALAHGFVSSTHFSTQFRAAFGMCPSDYRRQYGPFSED